MHYIIMSNLLLQFTQFIHYPLLPLAFYHFIVLYIRACIWLIFIEARNKRTCNEYNNSDNESDTLYVYFNSFFLNFIVCVSSCNFLWLQYIINGCIYIK